MKIRQKIAMLLAAAMTLTAVPMVTMAQADIKVVSGIKTGEKDSKVSNSLRVEMKDATDQPFDIFVSLENAEFPQEASDLTSKVVKGVAATDDAVLGTDSFTKITAKKEMRVRIVPTSNTTAKFIIPLDNVILKGGDATVAVDGAGSVISDISPVVFARTSDSKAKITVADSENIYTDAKTVAKITIDEPFQNVLSNSEEIKFTVRHSDYEITKAVVNYERGFSGTASKEYTSADTANFEDSDTIFKFFPTVNYGGSNATGRITVVLTLDTSEKKPATGKVEVKVSGDDVDGATVTVAEIKEYGTELEMKDKKVVDVTAGQNKEITFKVKEVVADTFSSNRDFDLVLENGYLAPRKDGATYSKDAFAKGLTVADGADYKFNAKTYLKAAVTLPTGITFVDAITDEDDYVIGMTVNISKTLDPKDEDDFEFKDLTVFTPVAASGDVTITVDGRALGNEASVVAMNIKPSITVKAEPMTIKVGLKEQTGGKIVVSEADAAVMKQGEMVYVKIDDSDSAGLKLKDTDIADKVVVTSGDLIIDKDSIDVKNGVVIFKVKRESTEASTITISDLTVYADRTVPQGTYDVKVGGPSFSEDWSTSDTSMIKDLKVKEFVIVGTPNTEDITANGLKKGTASFVIGSSKYVVNGVEAEMDGAVYLDNGRTMVPVRYVANALGVPATDIFFAAGTATILAGSKTVSLTVGDKVAKLNGVPARTMVSAPVVKDGRTYVPVAEIGALLGVEAVWDSAAQSATFTNK
jgi:hypothetical protein